MTKKSNGPTVAEKIRKYAAENPAAGAADIAKAVGTKVQYVHTVWYLDRKSKKSAVKRKVGRPAKARTLNDILGLPNQSDWQIKSLEGEVANLKAVVRYLEGRLYGASI